MIFFSFQNQIHFVHSMQNVLTAISKAKKDKEMKRFDITKKKNRLCSGSTCKKDSLPPTNDSDVTREGPIGVAETLVAIEMPGAEPQRGDGDGLWGNSGREGLCGGQARRNRRGGGRGGGHAGGGRHCNRKQMVRTAVYKRACVIHAGILTSSQNMRHSCTITIALHI